MSSRPERLDTLSSPILNGSASSSLCVWIKNKYFWFPMWTDSRPYNLTLMGHTFKGHWHQVQWVNWINVTLLTTNIFEFLEMHNTVFLTLKFFQYSLKSFSFHSLWKLWKHYCNQLETLLAAGELTDIHMLHEIQGVNNEFILKIK